MSYNTSCETEKSEKSDKEDKAIPTSTKTTGTGKNFLLMSIIKTITLTSKRTKTWFNKTIVQ